MVMAHFVKVMAPIGVVTAPIGVVTASLWRGDGPIFKQNRHLQRAGELSSARSGGRLTCAGGKTAFGRHSA